MVTVLVTLDHADQMSTLQSAVDRLSRRHADCRLEALSDAGRIYFSIGERSVLIKDVWNAISRAQMMLLLEPVDPALVCLVIRYDQLS
jgi:hypothetical protein